MTANTKWRTVKHLYEITVDGFASMCSNWHTWTLLAYLKPHIFKHQHILPLNGSKNRYFKMCSRGTFDFCFPSAVLQQTYQCWHLSVLTFGQDTHLVIGANILARVDGPWSGYGDPDPANLRWNTYNITLKDNFIWLTLGNCPCKRCHIEGILPNGPYPPCLRMADRALLAGYPRYQDIAITSQECPLLPRPLHIAFSRFGFSKPMRMASNDDNFIKLSKNFSNSYQNMCFQREK